MRPDNPASEIGVFPGLSDPFTQHLDYSTRRTGERTASAWIPRRDDLLDEHGGVRVGVLAYLTDATAGVVCGAAAVPGWVVTADLQMRVLSNQAVGPLRADAFVRRPGRRQSLGEVAVFDEGSCDRCLAVGTVNHLVITPDALLDVPSDMSVGDLYIRAQPATEEALVPIATLLKFKRLSDGGVEAPITGIAVNPLGFLHGGIIALLVEECALAHRGTVRDLMVRFVGPVSEEQAVAMPSELRRDGDAAILQVRVADDSGRVGAVASAALAL